MSKNIYKNTKNNIKNFHYDDIAVEIGIYDNNDTLSKEEIIPLGNYLHDPLPSNSELEITRTLCSRIIK